MLAPCLLLLAFDRLPVVAPAPGWELGMVSWVAVDRAGHRYLLQRGAKADPVVVLDRDGRVRRSWGKGLYVMPHAIRLDPKGNVWTLDAASSKVIQFSPRGQVMRTIEVGGQPSPCPNNFCGTTDIAFAPDGHLFITDGYANARVLEYTAEGRKVREWGKPGTGPGEFKLPHAIACDERGVLYIADRENARIQRFTRDGQFLGEFTGYGRVFGLTLVGRDLYIVAQPREERNGAPGTVMRLDRETGRVLWQAPTGGGGHGIAVGRGGEVMTAPGPGHPELFVPLSKSGSAKP